MLNVLLNNLMPTPVYAQEADSPMQLVDAAARGVNILILISGAVFIGFVLLAAFKFATASGDPKGIEGAKQSLTYAVIGLCVVLGTFAINAIVLSILNPSGGPDTSNPDNLFDAIRAALGDILDFAGVEGY